MRAFLRQNSLSLVFGALFLGTLVGQALVGHADFNAAQVAHNSDTISLWRFIRSSEFGVDVLENWQSEYLQFSLFILGTVWLIQRGSPESKKQQDVGLESAAEQKVGEHADADSPRWARSGGWRTRLFSNSLLLVMGSIWLASWLGQSITGRVAYNAERFDHQQAAVDWGATCSRPISGTGRCRTGSPSSSPSARWPCCRSTSASAARPSPSRSAARTPRRASKADGQRAQRTSASATTSPSSAEALASAPLRSARAALTSSSSSQATDAL